MKLHFLGTGTSFGIPLVGCECAVCTSTDPRDRRTRHGAAIEAEDGRVVLVDTPPELRLQLLRARLGRIDAVWFTHGHADHTHGIDDLRVFTARARRPLTAWADTATAALLRTRFAYIFDPDYRPPEGTSRPEIRIETFDASRAVDVAGFTMWPLEVPHGDVAAFGFRVGKIGYLTDAKRIPPATLERLRGVELLVLNALWFGHPHPTHLNIEEAIEAAREVGAERTFLTHLTHRVLHADLENRLPAGVYAAYDGLVVDIPDSSDPGGAGP